MNISNLSAQQLRQAASIKDQIQSLENQLAKLLGFSTPATAPKPAKKRTMSPAAKAKLSAKLKAVWAKRKGTNKRKGKSKMSPAAKARLSAKMKAIWAKRKAGKK
jgi:hypothetical protein